MTSISIVIIFVLRPEVASLSRQRAPIGREHRIDRMQRSGRAERSERACPAVEDRPAVADEDGFDLRILVDNSLHRSDGLCAVGELGVGQ